MTQTTRATPPFPLHRPAAPLQKLPRDPLPLGMLSPASAIAPDDDPRMAPEILVVSEPPPARVLP